MESGGVPTARHAVAAPPLKGHQLSGAASKSYSVASAWERTAALDDEQLRVLDALAQAAGQRPLPQHLSDDAPGADAPGGQQQPPGGDGGAAGGSAAAGDAASLEDAVLHNAAQFHAWHSRLEAACASETEEKYRRYGEMLQAHLGAVDALQDKVAATLGLCDALVELHGQVAASSAALSGAAQKLLAQKDALSEFADALRARLRFFDEYENAAGQFAAAAAAPDGGDLLPLLRRLDDCIAYVAANPQYADAVAYAGKFRALQARALGLVRARVQAVLRGAAQAVTAAVAEALAGAGGGTAVLPEGLEVSLLYVRFRAAAEPALRGVLVELEAKASRPEYARLLDDCRQLYCSIRLQLVEPHLSSRLAGQQGLPLPQLVRAGAEQLLRLSQAEGQLCEQLLGAAAAVRPPLPGTAAATGAPAPLSSGLAEGLRPLLEPLGQLLYDVLRPRFVQLTDMDVLGELVDILQHEVLHDQLLRRAGPGGEALVPSLSRALADLQERLIYRAQAFIKDQVEGFSPRPQDLAYPAKLEAAAAAAEAAAAAAAAEGDATVASDGTGAHDNGGEQASAEAAGAAWYPPVRSTLLLLSQLYRCIDARTFAGLANEAVAACTASVQAAGRSIAKQSGPVDGQLFVIQHLLFLREQIASFDVDLTVTDVDLDFSHMRDHMRRIMSGEASLFTLSSSNAIAQMLGRGGPRVVSASSDSKRDLEAQLKAACEAFIMATTKAAVEPLLSFITKVTAVRLAAGSNPALAKPLREQAFGAPAKLAEAVASVNDAMATRLPPLVAKAALYLPNPATRAILFRPVKSNVAEAHGQVASLLAAEYAPDEAAGVPLLQPDALREALEQLS